MTTGSPGFTSTAKAVINLSACRHNLRLAQQAAPDSKNMAIIKANAYGHGIEQVAHALSDDADAFGVARLKEAIQLREAGIVIPVILLEGFSSIEDITHIQQYELETVIHHASQLELLKQAAGNKIKCWIKIDSGMHRLGFQPGENDALTELGDVEIVEKPLVFMTHLSDADDKYSDKTLQQVDTFFNAIDFDGDSRAAISIANSAGILGWPQTHGNYNRPGIMLYGVSPFLPEQQQDFQLQPVMTLTSRLISIKNIKKGETIGYGSTYTCEQDKRVGIVAIGYGDGYPRHAPTGTPVLVNEEKTELLGRVSMDMICVDLDNLPAAKIGDKVTLWGEGLPVEVIADAAGTIAYELLCGVTSRVEFEYLD